ncbi:MAG: DUF1257 domain-containing protein [Deltaproteobacteria bacterium]|nr:DUF1257 domain-containing protein [Deltaproteobacteria bacterium]
MSHISMILTKLVSAQHIIRALKDMGFSEVWTLHDDEIIIRAKNTGIPKTDVRFSRMKDGRFKAQISEFDMGSFNHTWLEKLTQRYAYHVAMDTLKEQNFEMIEESVERSGTIHLTLRRMAG